MREVRFRNLHITRRKTDEEEKKDRLVGEEGCRIGKQCLGKKNRKREEGKRSFEWGTGLNKLAGKSREDVCVCNYLSSEHPCGSSQPSLALYEIGGEREPRVLSSGSLLGKVGMGIKPLGEQMVAAAHVAEEPCFQGG